VRVQMQAQFWIAGDLAFGDRDHHKGRVVSLSLEQDYFTSLEQLQVWHRMDESSPLWPMRNDIGRHLDGVEVSISAFDCASLQQVMFFKRYEPSHLIPDSVFVNTLSATGLNSTQLEADHSKLDKVTPEESLDAMRPATRVRKRSLSGLPQSLLSSLCSSLSATESKENGCNSCSSEATTESKKRESSDEKDEKLRTRSLQRGGSCGDLASAAFAALLGAGRRDEHDPCSSPALTTTPPPGNASARLSGPSDRKRSSTELGNGMYDV